MLQSVQRCEDDAMKGTGMVLGKGKGTSRGCEAPRGQRQQEVTALPQPQGTRHKGRPKVTESRAVKKGPTWPVASGSPATWRATAR